jgi:hypothetical protein
VSLPFLALHCIASAEKSAFARLLRVCPCLPAVPKHGNLEKWAHQGVLLLNAGEAAGQLTGSRGRGGQAGWQAGRLAKANTGRAPQHELLADLEALLSVCPSVLPVCLSTSIPPRLPFAALQC